MASTGELCIRNLFGDSVASDTEDEAPSITISKTVFEESPSNEKTSVKKAASPKVESSQKKVAPNEPTKKEVYKDYLDLTSLLTHMPTYKAVAPRIISLIVSDLQSRKLRRTTRDEVLTAALSNGLKCQNLIRRRFATYDLLLPTKEDCEALARKVLVHNQLRIQTEYRGRRLIKVTLFKAPSRLTEKQIATYFQQYGEVVTLSSRISRIGFPYQEWDVQIYLDREGYDSIPELFTDHGFRLPIVVEGRRPLCWNCSRMGHLATECLKKVPTNKPVPNPTRNRVPSRARPGTRPVTNSPVFKTGYNGRSPTVFNGNAIPQNQRKSNNRNRLRLRRTRRSSLSSC